MMLPGAKQMDLNGSSFDKLELHLCRPNLSCQMKITRNVTCPSGKNKQMEKTHLPQATLLRDPGVRYT